MTTRTNANEKFLIHVSWHTNPVLKKPAHSIFIIYHLQRTSNELQGIPRSRKDMTMVLSIKKMKCHVYFKSYNKHICENPISAYKIITNPHSKDTHMRTWLKCIECW